MSRIAKPAEKVLAMAGIYQRLVEELGLDPEPVTLFQSTEVITKEQLKDVQLKLIPSGPMEVTWRIDPAVMAALIDAATRIAMATDTRDMGVMGVTGHVPSTPDVDVPVIKPERVNDAVEWMRQTPDVPLPSEWFE